MKDMATQRFRALATLFVMLLALVGASSVAADQWIHVRVNEGDDEEVVVNLPLSLLSAAAALIPDEVDEEAHIALDDVDMSWNDLRTFWQAVKDAPEATFVTVQTKEENVEVKKEGEFLLIQTVESRQGGADVNVTFPLAVVDALLSGPDNTLDFEAALQALADHGSGNLVSVRDGNETVRIWIDERQTAD